MGGSYQMKHHALYSFQQHIATRTQVHPSDQGADPMSEVSRYFCYNRTYELGPTRASSSQPHPPSVAISRAEQVEPLEALQCRVVVGTRRNIRVIRQHRSVEYEVAHTLSIEVPEPVYEMLVKRAEETGQQPEALAAEWLASAAERTAQDDPLEPFIGAFDTGVDGWTTKHDQYLGSALLNDHTSNPPNLPNGEHE